MKGRKLGEPVKAADKKRAPVRVKHLKKQLHAQLVMEDAPVDVDPVKGLEAALESAYKVYLLCQAGLLAQADDPVYGQLPLIRREDGSTMNNPYLTMLRNAQHDLAQVSVGAVKVGLDAKIADAIERQADAIAGVMTALVDELGLTAAQRRKLPQAMGGALRLLDSGGG